MKKSIHFLSYLAQFFLEWKIFETKVVEEIKTHFVFNNLSFENCAFNEIVQKNFPELDKPPMTTWRMRIVRSIPKSTNTHLEYVILIAFPLQQWLEERSSVFTLYEQCLSCCKLKLCLYLKRTVYWEVIPYSSVGKYDFFRRASLHIYPTTRHHISDDSKLLMFDVHESVLCDTTTKITNKLHCID